MSIVAKIKKNFKLAPLTTFKIGGPARYFIEIKNLTELAEMINWAKAKRQPIDILAGGSNVLVNDRGVKGLVMKISLSGLKIKAGKIECEAGEKLSKATSLAAKHGLSGLEWASGIPGTVGGAVHGNAGAFGSQMSQIVFKVIAFDSLKNRLNSFANNDCRFNYRDSIFKQSDNLIIVRVILKFSKGKRTEIDNLAKKYFNYRLKTQPKYPSAGSIFKNLPLNNLSKRNFKLAEEMKARGLVKGGKVASAWLIDRLDLKGKAIGGAKISEQHANFIVNTGKAKSNEIVRLINFIKRKVKAKYKIILEEEIKYLGF